MKRIYIYLLLFVLQSFAAKAQYFGGQGRGDIMVQITTVYLPIELLNFTAVGETNKVRLNWRTASETNNNFFTIEKSLNGTDWNTIGIVKGAGNSTQILNYESYDYKPVTGTQYYRLKQSDFDGKYDYSKSVAVEFKENFSFSLYPNPAHANTSVFINIKTSAEEDKSILVVVYDITGREIYSKINILEKENGQITAVDPSMTLSPGIYVISASADNAIYKEKLVIR